MSVYKSLYKEYKNEEKAKREVLKIAKEALVNFGMKGDIYKTYEILRNKYSQSNNEVKKFEIYQKIEVLQHAISIIKEENSFGK